MRAAEPSDPPLPGTPLRDDLVVLLVRSVLHADADLPEGLAEQVVDTLLQGLGPTGSPPVSSA